MAVAESEVAAVESDVFLAAISVAFSSSRSSAPGIKGGPKRLLASAVCENNAKNYFLHKNIIFKFKMFENV